MKNTFIAFVLLLHIVSGLYATKDKSLRDALEKHVQILASDSLEGRGLGTDGAERARKYITDQFSEVGISPWYKTSDDYFQLFGLRRQLIWAKALNIVGFIEGSDPVLKDEYIVIGAHYDHLGFDFDDKEQKTIYPGADDNASGVSAIIELGKHFAASPHLLKRSLLVIAFDAEESGLLGAEYFINNLPIDPGQIKIMFSLDMVGMLKTHGKLDLKGINSAENMLEIIDNLAEIHNIKIGTTGNSIERHTDTAPFGDTGIPAVHVFTGLKSPYHKPEDTYDLLDYEGMVTIHSFMADLITRISAMPEIVPDAKSISDANNTRIKRAKRMYTGLTLNVGSGYHQYKDEFYRANSAVIGAVGLFVQLPLSRLLSVQQEVIYDLNGSKAEKGVFRRHAVTFPLHLQFGTPRISAANLRSYVFAGPYFRYNFAGFDGETPLNFTIYQEQEWGYSLGLGFDIFDFSFGYSSRSSLTSLFIDNQQPKVFDNNHYFSIGYRF